jgi:hypothetical protein
MLYRVATNRKLIVYDELARVWMAAVCRGLLSCFAFAGGTEKNFEEASVSIASPLFEIRIWDPPKTNEKCCLPKQVIY